MHLFTNIYWVPCVCQVPSKSLVSKEICSLPPRSLQLKEDRDKVNIFQFSPAGIVKAQAFWKERQFIRCMCTNSAFHQHGLQRTHPALGTSKWVSCSSCNCLVRIWRVFTFYENALGRIWRNLVMESHTLEDRCETDHRTTAKGLGHTVSI